MYECIELELFDRASHQNWNIQVLINTWVSILFIFTVRGVIVAEVTVWWDIKGTLGHVASYIPGVCVAPCQIAASRMVALGTVVSVYSKY